MTNMPAGAAPRTLTGLWTQMQELQREINLLRSRGTRGTPTTQQGYHSGTTNADGRIGFSHSLRAPIGYAWADVADSPNLYVVPVFWTDEALQFRVIHRVTGPLASTAVNLNWCAMTASRRR